MPRAYIHAGFARTATTLLQRNVFPRFQEHTLWTNETAEAGGILTFLRSLDDSEYDETECRRLLGVLLGEDRSEASLLISDETLVEPSLQLNAPALVQRSTVARRLARLFPGARILFTIRNQYDYLRSKFSMMKQNAAIFAGIDLGRFDVWLAAELAQHRSVHTLNLDFNATIATFEDHFGTDAVFVAAYEDMLDVPPVSFAATICTFLETEAGRFPILELERRVNQSAVSTEATALELVCRLDPDLLEPRQRQSLVRVIQAQLPDVPRSEIPISPTLEARIRDRCATGNARLEQAYGLNLRRHGYPLPS